MTQRVDRFLAALVVGQPQAAVHRDGTAGQFVVIDGVWTPDEIEAALNAAMTPSADEATQAMR